MHKIHVHTVVTLLLATTLQTQIKGTVGKRMSTNGHRPPCDHFRCNVTALKLLVTKMIAQRSAISAFVIRRSVRWAKVVVKPSATGIMGERINCAGKLENGK